MGEENTRGALAPRRALLAFAIAPYLAWMALMAALPSSAWAYAVRSVVTLVVLVLAYAWCRMFQSDDSPDCGLAALFPGRLSASRIAVGALAGIVVWAAWVMPECSETYRRLFIAGGGQPAVNAEPSPYDPAVCGWALTVARLLGSALVIPAAEELFFRGYLYRWIAGRDWLASSTTRFDLQAFLWTTGLFAVEHDRWLVGAAAGAAYALVAIRYGLFSAIVAHSVTNLVLGLQVILSGDWMFW